MSDPWDPDRAAAVARGESPEPSSESTGESTDESTESSSSTSGGSSRRSSIRSMLTSTTPRTSPRDVDGAFDISVPWFNHVECAITKATDSEGTPAWLHLGMALVLFVLQDGRMPSTASTGSDDGEDDEETPDGGLTV